MKRYDVVGAGGIGCAVGYVLRAAGVQVMFIDTSTDKVKWGRAHGVCVEGHPPLDADFVSFEEWTPAKDRPVLLCTKCFVNATVLARVPPGATVVPVQNGFDRAFDLRAPFVEGIASFVSECHPERTHTRITRAGRLHLGIRHPDSSDINPTREGGWKLGNSFLEVLTAQLSSALFRVQQVEDILPYKHAKLMYNAAIGPVAAAAGLDNGELLSKVSARRWFFGLLRENYAILRAVGIPLGKIGPFHPDTVQRILRQAWLSRLLTWAFYPTLRGTYCSMNADLLRGQTEIDYYNGYLIELAGSRPCPLNRGIYDLVKRMEREGIRPDLDVLDVELQGEVVAS